MSILWIWQDRKKKKRPKFHTINTYFLQQVVDPFNIWKLGRKQVPTHIKATAPQGQLYLFHKIVHLTRDSGRGGREWLFIVEQNFKQKNLPYIFLKKKKLTSKPEDTVYVRCCAQLLQSCPTLCDPQDRSPRGSFVHGIFQARILEWVAMPSSRGSSRTRDRTCVSCVSWTAGGFFTHWVTGNAGLKLIIKSHTDSSCL